MRCELCNHENEAGVKFCAKCGAEMPETPMDYENQADFPSSDFQGSDSPANDFQANAAGAGSGAGVSGALPIAMIKKIAVPVVIVLVVIAIAAIALTIVRGPNVAVKKNSISFFQNEDRDAVIVSANNGKTFEIDGKESDSQISLDGSKAVILTVDEDYENTLWFVTPKKATRIAKEVSDFKISDSGKGVAYLVKDEDEDEEVAELYLYNTSSGKSKLITKDCVSSATAVCISPNGKSVGYVGDFDEDEEEFKGYVSINGKKPVSFGKNKMPVAIADGGKYIYYASMKSDGDAAFYVKKGAKEGKKEQKLFSEMVYAGGMLLNKDYSELIFSVGNKSYISRKGGERKTLSSSKTVSSLLVPENAQYRGDGGVYGVRTFANTIAVSDSNELLRINKKFDMKRLFNNAYDASISSNGKTVVYKNKSYSEDAKLIRVNPTKKEPGKAEIAEDIRLFRMSKDGKITYFINDEEELLCVKGKKVTKIDDEEVAFEKGLAMNNGNKVFYMREVYDRDDNDYDERDDVGVLCSSVNGKKPQVIADDVNSFWSTATSVYYATVDGEVFRSDGKGKFTKLDDVDYGSSDDYDW